MRNLIVLLFPLILLANSCSKPKLEPRSTASTSDSTDTTYTPPAYLFSKTFPDFVKGSIKCSDNRILVWGHYLDANVSPMLMKLDANNAREQWMMTYDRSVINEITDVAEKQGGGFIVCGVTANKPNEHTIVFSVNENGEKLWEKIVGDSLTSQHSSKIIRTYDGNFIITAFSPQLGVSVPATRHLNILKIDADGNELWRKMDADELSLEVTSLVEMNDHSIVVCEGIDYSPGRMNFVHLDEFGNRILRTQIQRPAVYGMTALKAVEMNNGNLLVSGIQSLQLGSVFQGMVLRMNTNGNVINEEVYSNDTASIYLTNILLLDNDKYFAAGQLARYPSMGQVYMAWADENNNKISDKLQPVLGVNNRLVSMHTNDSAYIFLGNNPSQMFAVGVDKQGRVVINNTLQ